jgi:hypothetical protein
MQGLGHSYNPEGNRYLIYSFGSLACPRRTDVYDLSPYALENRPSSGEHLVRSTAHDGEGGVARSDISSGNRSVAEINPDLSAPYACFDGFARGDGSRIDNQRTARKVRYQARFSPQQFVKGGPVGYRHEHGGGLLGKLGRSGSRNNSIPSQSHNFARCSRVSKDDVPFASQVPRHAGAHDPETDDAYGFVGITHIDILVHGILPDESVL